MKNPEVKKGDKIILINSTQGLSSLNGKILEVAAITNKVNNQFSVKNIDTNQSMGTVYGLYDEFVLADRKARIEYNKSKIESLKKEIEDLKADNEHLEKYETEEDFVADKLESILTAHSYNKSKTSRVSAIKDVLSTLKKSSLL